MKALNAIKISKTRRYQISKLDKDDQKTWLANRVFGTKNRVFFDSFESTRKVKSIKTIDQLKGCLKSSYQFTDHTPKQSAPDWIGIEIECYLPKDNFQESYGDCDGSCTEDCTCRNCSHCGQYDENADCNCDHTDECGGNDCGYFEDVKKQLRKENIKFLDISDDGSLRPNRDEFGIELKIMLNLSNPKPLEKLCAWLNKNDARIDTHCGLHVHLDKSFLDNERGDMLESNFKNMLPIMAKLVSPSRINNQYCKVIVSTGKYSAVHVMGNTIEVRLHNGTTNFEKIYNWCLFLQAIKNAAIDRIEIKTDSKRLNNSVAKLLKLSDENRDFLLSRQSKFNNEELNDGSEESAA